MGKVVYTFNFMYRNKQIMDLRVASQNLVTMYRDQIYTAAQNAVHKKQKRATCINKQPV